MLPPAPPLRTVLESFPSHGSSISKAPIKEPANQSPVTSYLADCTLLNGSRFTRRWKVAPAGSPSRERDVDGTAVICNTAFTGSAVSGVPRHPREVCSLPLRSRNVSRRVMLQRMGCAIRIRSITERHWLSPSSLTRSPFGQPYGFPTSWKRSATGLPCSAGMTDAAQAQQEWVRSSLYAGSVWCP